MISKQLIAFFAGVVIVVVGAAAFLLYDQQSGQEITSDADNGSGDKKYSNDPTSGFTSYNGQQYFVKYEGESYSSSNYITTFTLSFTASKPGVLTAYLDNIQIPVKVNPTNEYSVNYNAGFNSIPITYKVREANFVGINFVKNIQYDFHPNY